jgi:hypothetical protein
MSSLDEKINFLVANSDMTADCAMQFVADIFKLGVLAAPCRKEMTPPKPHILREDLKELNFNIPAPGTAAHLEYQERRYKNGLTNQ